MKKLLIALILIPFMAGQAMAAGSLAATSDKTYTGVSGKAETRQILIAVTWDASAVAPDNTALKDITGITKDLGAWYVEAADWIPGATGPTDDTDFHLWSTEDKIDVFGNEGVDEIDEATNNTFFPATMTRQLTGDEIVDFDNNAVNSATGTLKLYLYR